MSVAAVLVPLIAGLLLSFLRATGPARAVALFATIATFVAAVLLSGTSGVSVPWIPGLGVTFTLDPAGAASVLVMAAALTMIPTVIWAGVRVSRRTHGFLALLLVMQASINGLFLAKDLVLFYVFWEAALIPSLLMLGGWGGERRREATMKYLLYALTGSFLMLVAILALKPLSGAESYLLSDLLLATPALPVTTQSWLFAAFVIAFAVKLPILPLHSWLIDFHVQNHPSGSADVAGSLYKVGAFGFFAWALPLLPAAAERWSPLLLALSAVTALYAAIIATRQTDLKRLLAYASLSHMGVAGAGVFALEVAGANGAMYLLAAQMISTGGLFLLAGMLHARSGSFDLDAYGGLAKSAPAFAGVSLFVLFASIGVPGLANFPGEFLSLLGAFQASVAAGVVTVAAVIAAGVYGVNLYQRIYQGKPTRAVADLGSVEVLVLIPILAGILWLGLAPAPQLERIEAQSRLAIEGPLATPAPARTPDGTQADNVSGQREVR
ncbi:MAG: NADH-quinone oxidoreductase subunit M [Trueperaceae bacterium]